MKKYLIFAALFLLLTTSDSFACSCVTPEVPKAHHDAQAVFLGEVTEIIYPRTNRLKAPLADRLFRIKFKVEKSWKGTTTQEIVILSDQGRAGCFSWGPFLKGRKYLVYAERRTPSGARIRDLAVLYSCNRTELLSNATEDVRLLNMMRTRSTITPKKYGKRGLLNATPQLSSFGSLLPVRPRRVGHTQCETFRERVQQRTAQRSH